MEYYLLNGEPIEKDVIMHLDENEREVIHAPFDLEEDEANNITYVTIDTDNWYDCCEDDDEYMKCYIDMLDVNRLNTDEENALMNVLEFSQDKELNNKIFEKTNIDHVDKYAENALMIALRWSEDKELNNKIFEKTINIDHINRFGYNALMVALRYSKDKKLNNKIFKKTTNINIIKNDSYNILIHALMWSTN